MLLNSTKFYIVFYKHFLLEILLANCEIIYFNVNMKSSYVLCNVRSDRVNIMSHSYVIVLFRSVKISRDCVRPFLLYVNYWPTRTIEVTADARLMFLATQ